MTTRTTLPMPAQPSNATMGNATSQIKGSPTACASLASVAITVSKVSCPCGMEGLQKKQGSKELIFLQNGPSDSEEEAMHGGLSDRPREVTCNAISGSLNQLHCQGTFTKEGYCAGDGVIMDTD